MGISCHLVRRGSYLSVSWGKQAAAGEIRLFRLIAEGDRSDSSKCQTCQYWSHRNGEGRAELLLLQPWMDTDTHTPSQGAAALVTGKTRQIYVPGLLLLLGMGNQHSIWGANRERLAAKTRHSHSAASRLKVSKHTSSRTWLPASIRLLTMFLQPRWM